MDKAVWQAGNSSGKLYPVGVLPTNAWGLHDMLCNVWEWTADWYGAYRTYSGFAAVDPTGPSTGLFWVFRGRSPYGVADGVRAAARHAGIATPSASAWP